MNFNRIIDISRKIHPLAAAWPGDKSVDIHREISIKSGGSCNLSSIRMGLHTGTHIDAPFHFADEGDTVELLDLSRFIGFVEVFELNVEKCIKAEDIKQLPVKENSIVFFKTSNSLLSEDEAFFRDFVYIDVSAANYLVGKKVKTVGVDYFSVECFGSKSHQVHKLLLSNGIGIIEGLNLKDVKGGRYFFSSLPLRIFGVDGSPARAVLVELED